MRYLFLLCSLLPTVIVGQNLSVKLGQVIDKKMIRDNYDSETLEGALLQIIGLYSTSYTNFFNIRTQKAYMGSVSSGAKYYQIGVLDEYTTLHEVKRLAADFVDDPTEKIMMEAFLTVGGKMYALYSIKRASRNEVTVYINELSSEMVVMGSPIRIASFQDIKKYDANIFVVASYNNSSFLVGRSRNTKARENETLECVMLNSEFSTQWSKTISLTQKDKEVTLSDINIDDAGNLYILGIEHPGMYKDVPAIFTYLWQKDMYKEQIVGRDDYEIFGTRLFAVNGNGPLVAGMHIKFGISGFFVNKVNPETGALDEITFMAADAKGKEMLPKYPNPGNYRVENLVQLESGKYVITMEDRQSSIWAACFGSDNQLAWSNLVHKKQLGFQSSPYGGHVLLSSGNNTFVLYNDNPSNNKKSISVTDVSNYTGTSGNVVAQQFDETGKGKKYTLLKGTEGENYNLKTNQVFKITDSLFQIKLSFRNYMSQPDAKYRYATIELK